MIDFSTPYIIQNGIKKLKYNSSKYTIINIKDIDKQQVCDIILEHRNSVIDTCSNKVSNLSSNETYVMINKVLDYVTKLDKLIFELKQLSYSTKIIYIYNDIIEIFSSLLENELDKLEKSIKLSESTLEIFNYSKAIVGITNLLKELKKNDNKQNVLKDATTTN